MRTPPHIVLLDADSLSPEVLDHGALKDRAAHYTYYGYSAKDEVPARIKGADIVLSNKALLGAEVIAGAPDLSLISVLATGYNNVDIEAAVRHGVTVCNVSSYSTQSVVQHVFMLMFNLHSHFARYHADVQAGKWQRSQQFCLLDYPITQVQGKTLGIIGYGEIGEAVAKAAACFGMNVLISERKGATSCRAGRTPFEAVIAESDIITLHCPLNDETRDYIAQPELSAMKQSAYLLNVARGGVVNEAALAEALQAGAIAGAGVDVLTQEPPSSGNPLLEVNVPNLLITPHVAWTSLEAQRTLFADTLRNIDAYCSGAPVNVVAAP